MNRKVTVAEMHRISIRYKCPKRKVVMSATIDRSNFQYSSSRQQFDSDEFYADFACRCGERHHIDLEHYYLPSTSGRGE